MSWGGGGAQAEDVGVPGQRSGAVAGVERDMVDADQVHAGSLRRRSAAPAMDSMLIESFARRKRPPARCRAMTTTTTITRTAHPYVARASQPRWYGNSLFEFLVPNDATGGRITVFRATMPEGFSPPRHIHTREDEVFLVLEGEARFDLDGEQVVAGPGTSVFMPRGVPHTFRVPSPVAVMLGIMTPAPSRSCFRNLGVPAAERTLPPAGARPVRRRARHGRADAARHAGRRPADGGMMIAEDRRGDLASALVAGRCDCVAGVSTVGRVAVLPRDRASTVVRDFCPSTAAPERL